jgi:hypothetical protein
MLWLLDIFLQNRSAVVVLVLTIVVFVVVNRFPSPKLQRAVDHLRLGDLSRDTRPHRTGDAQSGEERCRRFIKKTTGIDFVRVRPRWLRNPATGRCLELDMFTPHPRPIAFEFDGRQHTHYTHFYHGTVRSFEESLQRDRLKDRLCKQNGVELVRIPHEVHDQPEAFVYTQLVRLGLVQPPQQVVTGGGRAAVPVQPTSPLR